MKVKNKFFKSGMTLVVSLLFFTASAQPQVGMWRGLLELNDSVKLPVNFEIKQNDRKYSVVFYNAEEQIETQDIFIQNDSVFIKMPVFDSEFKLKLNAGEMKGVWINHARRDKNVLTFRANFNPHYFNSGTAESWEKIPPGNKYEATFSPGSLDSSKAITLLKGDGLHIRGTFLTETGDYRFLYGATYGMSISGEGPYQLILSCFDGSHAFLFSGIMKDDSIINGHFYSGAHHHETWVARRNDTFELRNPDSLTYLKPGYTGIDFSFKNTEGKKVSLKDKKFKNKVVIVQLMGTWCPNCIDETKFLAPFYDKYKSKGLEIVALAFERTGDFTKAVSNIERTKKRFNANYEFLITEKTGKDQASQALPMLNEVMAFPTTIYIDKNGRVRKIYTGFYGPATGEKYTRFVEETERFVDKLLAE